MKKVVEITAIDIEHMADTPNKAVKLRAFAIGLVNHVNNAHSLIEILQSHIILGYTLSIKSHGCINVLTIPYQHKMTLPCPINLDERWVINCEARMVEWRVAFYEKFGPCEMVQSPVDAMYWGVNPNTKDLPLEYAYWESVHRYLALKVESITKFYRNEK